MAVVVEKDNIDDFLHKDKKVVTLVNFNEKYKRGEIVTYAVRLPPIYQKFNRTLSDGPTPLPFGHNS